MVSIEYTPPRACYVQIEGRLLIAPTFLVQIKKNNGDNWFTLDELSGYAYRDDDTDIREKNLTYLEECYFDTGNELKFVLLGDHYRDKFEELYGNRVQTCMLPHPLPGGNSVFGSCNEFNFRFTGTGGSVEFTSRIGFVTKWLGDFKKRLYMGMNIFCQLTSSIYPIPNGIYFFIKEVE